MNRNYIKSLVTPNTRKPQGRKVWSVDLENVWIPFFTAANTMGDYLTPADALGASIRLGYNKDGSVKFSPNGRPVTRVAKPISDNVQMVRENLISNLMEYVGDVQKDDAAGYKAQVEMARKAGEPIAVADARNLSNAIAEQMAAAAEAEAATAAPAAAVPAAAPKVADAPLVETVVESPAENAGEAETVPDAERELVPA